MPGPGQTYYRWPQFLPDGRRFLFFSMAGSPENSGVYVGSLDGGNAVRVIAAESAAVFAPPNWLLMVHQDTLMALPFDPTRAVVTGDAVPIAQATAGNLTQGRAALTVADTGVMVYATAEAVQPRQLVWRDRSGRAVGMVGQPDVTDMPSFALAPDGRRLVTSRTTQGNQDVWMMDVARGVPSRFTFDMARDNAPVWSADGQRILFRSARNGPYDLFEKPATGAGDERPLLQTSEAKITYDSSPDGRTLLYGVFGATTGADIWALPFTGDRMPFPVVQTKFGEDAAQVSPDGRWIAYESNEAGRFEVYVQAFPTARGKWQVSTGGGTYPRWRPDGKEIFYLAPDGRLTAAPILAGMNEQAIDIGTPVPLFTPRFASGGSIISPGSLARPLYAVTTDGRFLLNETAAAPGENDTASLTVVLNWDAELP
jgi:Tol biopolymer transport system component